MSGEQGVSECAAVLTGVLGEADGVLLSGEQGVSECAAGLVRSNKGGTSSTDHIESGQLIIKRQTLTPRAGEG